MARYEVAILVGELFWKRMKNNSHVLTCDDISGKGGLSKATESVKIFKIKGFATSFTGLWGFGGVCEGFL